MMATKHQLGELGRMVGKSEEAIFDLEKIERLGEALDFALTLIPGWKDSLITSPSTGWAIPREEGDA